MNNTTARTVQDSVISLFNAIHPVGEELSEAIRQQSRVLQFKKRDHLLRIGDICKPIYFIAHGGVRTYYINPEGQDITSWLLFEGELAISVYSFFGQQPSFEALEALEDCTVLALPHDKLAELYRTHLAFNYIGRYLTEQYYIRSEAKANALRMLSARERYLDLLERRPYILQRVPLGHIATYLGMTASTLSRIRASL